MTESCVSVRRKKGEVWKDCMERIMNEENVWDYDVDGDALEGLVVCVSREEVLHALNEMKTGKAPEPSEVSPELIAAIGGVGIQVMAEVCQRFLDGLGMPVEWALSIVVPIFEGTGNIWKCSCYRAVRLLQHGMKAVKKVLEKKAS